MLWESFRSSTFLQGDNLAELPGGENPEAPALRLPVSMGTRFNRAPFVILESDINNTKQQVSCSAPSSKWAPSHSKDTTRLLRFTKTLTDVAVDKIL
jgi:hypothetical protein